MGADNDYGHPAPEIARRAGAGRGAVLRTDQDGDVAVGRRDGGWWSMSADEPVLGGSRRGRHGAAVGAVWQAGPMAAIRPATCSAGSPW